MPVPSELLDATSDGLLTVAVDGRITYANAGAAALLGTQANALVGRSARSIVAKDSPVHPRFTGRGDELATTEVKLQREDGSSRWVLITEQLIGEDRGTPEAVVTLIDQTRHRALEERLRQAQKFEALGRLAGGIAHDFNNIITAMFGCCELLQPRLPSNDRPSHTYLEEILRSAGRAAELTHQLLAFSRPQLTEPRLISLDAVIDGAKGMLERIIGEDVLLVVGPAAGHARIYADPGQIEQVLMNLVVNARDAMPHGGQLTIETRVVSLPDPVSAPRQTLSPGRYVLMTVADTGLGVAPDIMPHIFEPFFTTKGEAGTGLGLATVYGITRHCGGDVHVTSAPGKTTFRVLLPAVETPADV